MSAKLANFVMKHGAELLQQFRSETRYKLPKTHPSWDMVSRLCVFALLSRKVDGYDKDNIGRPFHKHTLFLDWWRQCQLPVYCLGLDLMRQFENTDTRNLPRLVPDDWQPSLDAFMLIPPANTLVLGDGSCVVYIIVALRGKGQLSSRSDRGIAISLMSSLGSPTLWELPLDQWDLCLDTKDAQVATDEQFASLGPILERSVSIALQAGLSLSYLPELVEDGAEEAQGFRPRKAAAEKSNVRYPRWIGKNFTRQKRNPSANPTPSGITMATHWRRGHWRQQVCGEKWQQRKLQWIQPTLINP
jgi:hypothetical protein